MEEVVALCPELTWNQVFLAIDYLSRTGQICVTVDPGRTYRVQASPAPAAGDSLCFGKPPGKCEWRRLGNPLVLHDR